jgi:hypothetical protein
MPGIRIKWNGMLVNVSKSVMLLLLLLLLNTIMTLPI